MPTNQRPKQKAVLDGKIQRLSVSQIEGFDPTTPFGCMRRWWFKYVAGLPEPESSATQVGTQLHGEIERFIRDGENGLGRLALSGKQYIDEVANEEVRLIEHHFDGQVRAEKIPLVGYIDVVMPTRPEILDWKTTSDIGKWAKTPQQLGKSTQMLGYAKWYFGEYGDFDTVILTHVYFQTRGTPDSQKRSCAITFSDVEERWLDVERVVRSMVDVAKAPDPAKVPGTFDHKCYRCPFRGICPPAPQHPGEQDLDMSLLGIFESPSSDSAAPSPGPVAADTAAAGGKMEGQSAPVKPEDQKSTGPVENFTESTAKTLEGMSSGEALEVPAPGEGTKRKRGRPAGSKNKETTPAATGTVFKVLYINCIPVGLVEAAMGDRYVRQLCAKLEEPLGTHDLRIPPADPDKAKQWDAACGFGRWKGSLQALVRANPPEVETLILHVTDEVGKCVGEALAPLAEVVVRPLGGA